MLSKIFKITVGVVAILLLITVFIPAITSAIGQGQQRDSIEDEDGNIHKVYSRGEKVYYKNNVGCSWMPPWNRWNDPVLLGDSDKPSLFPKIDIEDGFIYATWIDMEAMNDDFYFTGCELEDWQNWGFPLKGADAPLPWEWNGRSYHYDMEAVGSEIQLTWDGGVQRTWTADIDGDMIPDVDDEEPLVYTVDNPSIAIEPDVVTMDNELGVTVAVDYEGEDETIPIITDSEGDFELSSGNYINISLDTDSDFHAMIKMDIDEVPETLTEEYLRMYRKVNTTWMPVANWDNDEQTGINLREGFTWAYTNQFSEFTQVDSSQDDADQDGMVTLTEDTEDSTEYIDHIGDTSGPSVLTTSAPDNIALMELESPLVNLECVYVGMDIYNENDDVTTINDFTIDVDDDGSIDYGPVDIVVDECLHISESSTDSQFLNAMTNSVFSNDVILNRQIPMRFRSYGGSKDGTDHIRISNIYIEFVGNIKYNYNQDNFQQSDLSISGTNNLELSFPEYND
ncbi:MAG: hypothetical protein R6U61_02445, partial [Thermoplasmata archaeon]